MIPEISFNGCHAFSDNGMELQVAVRFKLGTNLQALLQEATAISAKNNARYLVSDHPLRVVLDSNMITALILGALPKNVAVRFLVELIDFEIYRRVIG